MLGMSLAGVVQSAVQTLNLPLVSREWKNGSNSSYNCTPFLHSLLTKGNKQKQKRFRAEGFRGGALREMTCQASQESERAHTHSSPMPLPGCHSCALNSRPCGMQQAGG